MSEKRKFVGIFMKRRNGANLTLHAVSALEVCLMELGQFCRGHTHEPKTFLSMYSLGKVAR